MRISLLGEHAGLPPREAARKLGDVEGLVDTLNRLAELPEGALRRRPVPAGTGEETEWPAFDPAGPILEDEVFESIAPPRRARLRAGLRRLTRWRFRRVLAVDPPGELATAPDRLRMVISRALWRASFLSLVLLVALGVAWGVTAALGALLGR